MGYKRKETTNRAYKGLITRTGFNYDSMSEVGQIMGMELPSQTREKQNGRGRI